MVKGQEWFVYTGTWYCIDNGYSYPGLGSPQEI